MKTVLTIDDSKVVRAMVIKHLKDYGCRVVQAENGQQGLEVAKNEKPDLILLDVTMPVMDGRQTLTELRKDAELKSTPVIMLTAESGREIVVEIAKLGVKGYIVKPFQQDTFDKEVEKVLEKSAGDQPAGSVDEEAVLVVDDSERVLASAKEALEATVKVLTATSGREAVSCYREKRPAVVVIDLAMPEMDGFETLSQIKQLGANQCLALTLRGDDDARQRARKAGFVSLVSKPLQAAELLNKVLAARGGTKVGAAESATLVGDEKGTPVISLPDAQSQNFSRIAAECRKQLRALAEDGSTKLIIDISQVGEVKPVLLEALARITTEAGTLGLRTVICSPSENISGALEQIAELCDTPRASNREASLEALQ